MNYQQNPSFVSALLNFEGKVYVKCTYLCFIFHRTFSFLTNNVEMYSSNIKQFSISMFEYLRSELNILFSLSTDLYENTAVQENLYISNEIMCSNIHFIHYFMHIINKKWLLFLLRNYFLNYQQFYIMNMWWIILFFIIPKIQHFFLSFHIFFVECIVHFDKNVSHQKFLTANL